ncbi:hypothetical protein [Polaribacter marinivivus]|uniref:hypothetical protein n=1 Tax=Polaribacter marinivivus TaxID=1524260 RepID=UPI003D341F12
MTIMNAPVYLISLIVPIRESGSMLPQIVLGNYVKTKEKRKRIINNKVEGPVTFFYENGNIKSKGQYLDWKKTIGKWDYFDGQGKLVHSMTFTR